MQTIPMAHYNLNLITRRRSYNINEIASLLGVNRKTCGRWIKEEGLATIEGNTKPFLILGNDLIDFIKKQREKGKILVKENEFLCLKCRKGVKAKAGSKQTIKTGKTIGKDNHELFRKTGVCEFCETKLNKYSGVCQ